MNSGEISKQKRYTHAKARRKETLRIVVGYILAFIISGTILWFWLGAKGPLCGNGRVDPGENCTTCPEDVVCDPCYKCIGPECVFIGCPDDCGNGRIDPGETCFTCPEDFNCDICDNCIGVLCIPDPLCLCGNGQQDPGETCENCSTDIQCDEGTECDGEGKCSPICGNGNPDPGENCFNCPEDVPCGPGKICFEEKCIIKCNPIVEAMTVIFLFDTSGSMIDEAASLCQSLDGIEQRLVDLGLDVEIIVWGLAPGINITCLTGYASQYAPLHQESWGPGSGLVAANYPWKTVARILIPISDEGPFQGDPCTTAEDENSILWAIDECNLFDTIVSPLMGTVFNPLQEECIQSKGRALALGTGGSWHSTNGVVMEDLVLELIQATLCGCAGDLNGDGEVGILDFLLLLAGWGLPGQGDVDGDGDSDFIDILFMFNAWGPCD